MYNVPPWTREGEWEMWLFQHSSVSNDTALWIKWPCLFCRTVCTQMDQYKLVFNRNVHFSGGNTLIFWLIPPQKSSCTWASKYLFNFQFSIFNTFSIFSEAGENTCSAVNSYCISSLPIEPTNAIGVPSVHLLKVNPLPLSCPAPQHLWPGVTTATLQGLQQVNTK